MLDVLQKPQEGRGRKAGRDPGCAIDKPVLISVAYRFCFIEGGDALYMGVSGSRYPPQDTQTIIRLVAEVRA
jgi:hypothetical protein